MKLSTCIASLLAFCAVAVSMPLETRGSLPSGPDPAFSLSQAQLDSVLTCPLEAGGSYSNVQNPILLVPGTGTTGPVSFDHTYVPLSSKLGFQPCYISPPPNQNGDIQDSTQYFVNAVHRLSTASGKKIPVLGWSQGNLDIQLGLTFFPSTRNQTDRFVSFAGDFRGTIEAYLLTALTQYTPAVGQQRTGSHILRALKNAGGLQAIVPTTSIYSLTDEIVQLEGLAGKQASSYLPGAVNVQAQDICSPLFILEHSQELFNGFTYKVAKSALLSDTKVAKASDYSVKDCTELPPPELSPEDVLYDLTILLQAGVNIIEDPKVSCEPKLMPWAKAYDPSPEICLTPQSARRAVGEKPFTSQLELASGITGVRASAIQYFMDHGKAPSNNITDFSNKRDL